MNRRDFLKRTLAVSAAGLLVPIAEPVRRVWALDRTMVAPPPIITPGGLVGDPFTCVTASTGVTHIYPGSWIREMHADGYWREHVFTGREWVEIRKDNVKRLIPDLVLTARANPSLSGTFVFVDQGRGVLQMQVKDEDWSVGL